MAYDQQLADALREIERLRAIPAKLRESEYATAYPDSVFHGRMRSSYLQALRDVEHLMQSDNEQSPKSDHDGQSEDGR